MREKAILAWLFKVWQEFEGEQMFHPSMESARVFFSRVRAALNQYACSNVPGWVAMPDTDSPEAKEMNRILSDEEYAELEEKYNGTGKPVGYVVMNGVEHEVVCWEDGTPAKVWKGKNTNWDNLIKTLKPSTFASMLESESGTLGYCEHCPAKCREFCAKVEGEIEKRNWGDPCEETLASLDLCGERFLYWAIQEAEEETE